MKTYKRTISKYKFLRIWQQNKRNCTLVNHNNVQTDWRYYGLTDMLETGKLGHIKFGYHFDGFIYMYEPTVGRSSPSGIESEKFYRYKVDEVKAYKVNYEYFD